jgi:hypothetical protein
MLARSSVVADDVVYMGRTGGCSKVAFVRRVVLPFAVALLLITTVLAGCRTAKGAAGPSPAESCASTAPGGLAGGAGECATSPVASTSLAPAPPPSPTTSAAPNVPTETQGDCPYLNAQQAEDFEGNHVGRVTVVSTNPVGCNFYFAYGDGHMTLKISTQTFTKDVEAYNAMVAAGGAAATGVPGLIAGVDAVLYQTAFYARDGDHDWACSFAKGKVLVTVNTDQTTPSLNARLVAQAIAPKF